MTENVDVYSKINNEAFNKLVLKYGKEAKKNGVTLDKQVLNETNSITPTSEDIKLAKKIKQDFYDSLGINFNLPENTELVLDDNSLYYYTSCKYDTYDNALKDCQGHGFQMLYGSTVVPHNLNWASIHTYGKTGGVPVCPSGNTWIYDSYYNSSCLSKLHAVISSNLSNMYGQTCSNYKTMKAYYRCVANK